MQETLTTPTPGLQLQDRTGALFRAECATSGLAAAANTNNGPQEGSRASPGSLSMCIDGTGNNRSLNASMPGPCAQTRGPSAPWPTNKSQRQKEENGNL